MKNVDYRWNAIVEVDESDNVVENDHIVPQKAEDLLNGTPSSDHTLHSFQHVQTRYGSKGVRLELVLNHELNRGETLRNQIEEAAAKEFRQGDEKCHVEFQLINLPVHWNERLQSENADHTIAVVSGLEI